MKSQIKYLLFGFLGLVLLAGCTSREEYQQGLPGIWKGETGLHRWCMTLDTSGVAELLNETLNDAGQVTVKKVHSGTWEVRDGGRLNVQVEKNQETTYRHEEGSAVIEESKENDRSGTVRYYVVRMTEDNLVYKQQKMGGQFTEDINADRADQCK